MYKLNPFVQIFKRDNLYSLYNCLSLSTLYLSQEKYDDISLNPTQDLIDNEFYVDCNFDSLEYFTKYKAKTQTNSNIGLAYFLVTSNCNFKCEYCFIESRINDSPNSSMSIDIAKRGIELIKRNSKKKFKIIFYGGEPFLNFEILKFVAEEFEKTDLEIDYSIISNGSILNNEIIDFLKKYKVSLSISLDGLQETNDKMRKYHNEEGTYTRIKKTLEILKENNIQVGISCTISTSNIDKPDEILEILKEFEIKGFGFNLLTENNNVYINKELQIAMVNNILKAEEIVLKNKIIEDRIINRKLKPFVEKKHWTRDCAGYGKQIVITPKGEVGVCHGLWPDLINDIKTNYFDITVDYQEKINDHPTWKEWFNRTPFNMPQCWSCFGIGLCGGGCAKNSLIRHGSIWDIDEDICILTKKSIEWVIWQYYDIAVKNKIETKN